MKEGHILHFPKSLSRTYSKAARLVLEFDLYDVIPTWSLENSVREQPSAVSVSCINNFDFMEPLKEF